MPGILSAVFLLQWLQEVRFHLSNSTLLDGIPSKEFQIHLCKETLLQNWRIHLPQILLLFLPASETHPPHDRDNFLCRVVFDCCVESYWDQLVSLYQKRGYTRGWSFFTKSWKPPNFLTHYWHPYNSSVGEESAINVGDPGLIPGLGKFPGEGIGYLLQYSWAFLVTQLVKNLPAMWESWVQSLGWEDPLVKGKATHSSTLAWRTIYSPQGPKESDTTEPLSLSVSLPIWSI